MLPLSCNTEMTRVILGNIYHPLGQSLVPITAFATAATLLLSVVVRYVLHNAQMRNDVSFLEDLTCYRHQKKPLLRGGFRRSFLTQANVLLLATRVMHFNSTKFTWLALGYCLLMCIKDSSNWIVRAGWILWMIPTALMVYVACQFIPLIGLWVVFKLHLDGQMKQLLHKFEEMNRQSEPGRLPDPNYYLPRLEKKYLKLSIKVANFNRVFAVVLFSIMMSSSCTNAGILFFCIRNPFPILSNASAVVTVCFIVVSNMAVMLGASMARKAGHLFQTLNRSFRLFYNCMNSDTKRMVLNILQDIGSTGEQVKGMTLTTIEGNTFDRKMFQGYLVSFVSLFFLFLGFGQTD